MKNYIIIIFLLLSSYGFSQDINISTQPSALIECFGNSTSMYVLAYSESKQELKYQWYKDDTKLIGANSPLFKFENLNHNHTGLYFCEVSNNEEIIRTNIAPVYVLRSTSITKQPEDVTTYLDVASISINFEAHVNGKSIDEAINDGDLVNIQWYQKIENSEIKLDNKDIYDGVNSSRLNINTKSLSDTSYYFAEIEGQCGKARTRIVKIIKNLILFNLTINGLEACDGNVEAIRAIANNPNNYELQYQWYKNDKSIHYKENLDGYYTDELKFNPIHLLDSGIYKLEARIKGTNYVISSNEAKVEICSKPEIIAVRIDTISGYNLGGTFRNKNFIVFYKNNCSAKISIFKNDSLAGVRESKNDKLNGYNINNKNFGYSVFNYQLNVNAQNEDKFHVEIENNCGTEISDSLTIANDLNVFTNRDPWEQKREFCEDDTTTLEFYFHMNPKDYNSFFWSTENLTLQELYALLDSGYYQFTDKNKIQFKKIRLTDNRIWYLRIDFDDPTIKTIYSPGFLLLVKPIPQIKKQPINKTLYYEKKDTLLYIVFDNDKQIPISLDLYYMSSLTNKPRLIDKSEVEWGLWYRYIKEVSFEDKGYYYAVAKHYNDCKAVVSDTVYVDVLPKGITSIDDKENDRLIISPNPATDYITINLFSINPTLKRGVEGEVVVEIYDVMGVLIHSTPSASQPPLNEGNLRIDISNLSPGVYFVKIGDKVEKFIKM